MFELKWLRIKEILVNLSTTKEITVSDNCILFHHLSDPTPTIILFKNKEEAKNAFEFLSILMKGTKGKPLIEFPDRNLN